MSRNPDTPRRNRRILLADCDAMFVAVARLEDPEGIGREELLLVGGRPEGRGVVSSASYAARKYGVRSGMPMREAVRRCPDATVVSVPRDACSRVSRHIRRILDEFAPIVEPASIDEFYLDLTGTEELYRGESLERLARRVRARVLEETAISLSIGGGTNKMIAKLAAGRAKPAGVHIVAPGGERAFMSAFDLSDIPFVGPRFTERLARHGLRTVRDALAHDRRTLVRWLGDREGHWLYDRVRGIHSRPVRRPGPPKSISRETTFPENLHEDDALERALLALATRAASDLRARRMRARTVSVRLRDPQFDTRQAGRTLPRPIESDRAIFDVARTLLARLRRDRRTAARLLGVTLSQLDAGDGGGQLSLFADEDADGAETQRDRTLSRAVDDVRARFGDDALVPGRMVDRDDGDDG